MATEARAIPGPPGRRLRVARPRYGDLVIRGLLLLCAIVSVATTAGIIVALLGPSIEFFGEVSFKEFFTGTEWAPLFEPPKFGSLAIIAGTLNVTFWSLFVCIPFGLGAAIYLSEYAGPRRRRILKPTLEVLAGIPTVAYGYFALTFVTPILRDIWPGDFLGGPPGIFNALSAGLVLGVMILPIVASVADDAMQAVPTDLRAGALALGSTKLQVSTRVVVPAALSGIVAGFVLGISRAVGETVVVLVAAGNTPNFTLNPIEAIQTMTAFIATTGTGDVPTGSIEYKTIFAVGATLLAITFVMNLLSIRLVRRYREIYE